MTTGGFGMTFSLTPFHTLSYDPYHLQQSSYIYLDFYQNDI